MLGPSVVSDFLWPHIAHQAPLSMGFSRQEYWSGLPFPSPRDLLSPGLLHCRRSLVSEPPGKPLGIERDLEVWKGYPLSHVLQSASPMDCSPPGSSVHGILQARTLEWAVMPSSRGIFTTQGSNPSLPHCRQILYHLSRQSTHKWSNSLWQRN